MMEARDTVKLIFRDCSCRNSDALEFPTLLYYLLVADER